MWKVIRERGLVGRFVIIIGVLLMADIIDLVIGRDKMAYERAKADNILVIKKHEGGHNNDLNDLGGETNFGVSTKFLDQLHNQGRWLQYKSVNDIPTDDAATKIFEKEFFKYNRVNYGANMVSLKMNDIAVHTGGLNATKIMQRALNNLYGKDILTIDGQIAKKRKDSATLNLYEDALVEFGQDDLMHKIVYEQSSYYRELAAEKSSQANFLPGWLTRAKYIPK